ncbi:putative small secreted protein [Thioflavicoccus mobilis 8321]|uniref:Putative small secreted protein n=1 Tax=Thioflavicoccus mobilis 8321 TaxID=765912 RepID=L0GY53_9GAMM|nr:entericidin A/B family lipoprotein [Thioflavicoccus mobilis]AGA90310.1 putative small secreted protein [Thioflavicoccus mobilis 8321]
MKKLLIVHLLAIGFLAGCNTIEGVGEDVEAGGEGIQDAAESAK